MASTSSLGSLTHATPKPVAQEKDVREACDNLVGVFAREFDREVEFYRLLLGAYVKNKDEAPVTPSRPILVGSNSSPSLNIRPRELEPIGEVPVEERDKKKKEKKKKTEKEKKDEGNDKKDTKENDCKPSTSTAEYETEGKAKRKVKKDKKRQGKDTKGGY